MWLPVDNQRKVREIKLSSYQSKVCERLLELLMEYEDNEGVKFFQIFKGKVFYNAKLSIPTSKYPSLSIHISDLSREPLAIRRTDWWVMSIKVIVYTLDHSENDMDFHYKCVEGIDRVCRVNPHLHIDGKPDLSIHKADLEDASFTFAFGDKAIISESESTVVVRTKLCLASQIS